MKKRNIIYIIFIIGFAISLAPIQANNIYKKSTSHSSDSIIFNYLQQNNYPIADNNKISLINDGHSKFELVFNDIRKAKKYIYLEYFNFRNDSIGNALFNLLSEKVKEGVEVKAMFDAFGNMSNNRPLRNKHLKKIRAKGIEIVKFDPLKFPYITHALHRDHRKIIVIDGKITYTGGMNVADYYINGLPKFGAWKDTHLKIEGNASYYYEKIFAMMWLKETGHKIYVDKHYTTPSTIQQGHSTLAIINKIPQDEVNTITATYIKALESAQHNIKIITPYFTPTINVMAAIKDAIKRGVKVEILFSEKSDVPVTPDAALFNAYKMVNEDAEVYLYQKGFYHSKVTTIDDNTAIVGTANLNGRSLRYDYEVNTFIFDSNIVNQINQLFEREKEDSKHLQKGFWKKLPASKRLFSWFSNLLTPFL